MNSEVKIPSDKEILDGHLTVPDHATMLVVFAHGSGSSRHSPRNQFVARTLNDAADWFIHHAPKASFFLIQIAARDQTKFD